MNAKHVEPPEHNASGPVTGGQPGSPAKPVPPRKRIALVAHDNKKKDLMEWASFNRGTLLRHQLCATGTTGALLEKVLGVPVEKLRSGPLGGDQQIGAMIAEGTVEVLIFFIDPLSPLPHDVDVKALMRLAIVYDIPMALNRATAERLLDFAAD